MVYAMLCQAKKAVKLSADEMKALHPVIFRNLLGLWGIEHYEYIEPY